MNNLTFLHVFVGVFLSGLFKDFVPDFIKSFLSKRESKQKAFNDQKYQNLQDLKDSIIHFELNNSNSNNYQNILKNSKELSYYIEDFEFLQVLESSAPDLEKIKIYIRKELKK